ncbi:MAG: tRNA (adenosine(37)-N6)-threonylcarbamoyltransferase complex ATPase subunit type 1 TsaE [bacterium]|nr:tRNA (adenosine(37)-N6)-threonylcarbamoyltransferase complex ATPase subunit type 1 TsaE [bacterium]MCY4258142.1 tRNA (adenosine(37)-N6)-threonylcarbamoyltransferase complex ATPase subunit type 1 TsaE [bacterium]
MLATTTSPSQTQALAAALAEIAEPGDLVLLVGDLGAGKTTFTQGFAAGLGVSRQVTSPTFTLANEYRGRLLLNHLDVFRLEQISEVLDLDLFELLDGHGVTLIEWGNVVRQTLPDEYLEIALEFHDELEGSPKPISDHRTITLQLTGARWQARATTIQAALQPWLSSC